MNPGEDIILTPEVEVSMATNVGKEGPGRIPANVFLPFTDYGSRYGSTCCTVTVLETSGPDSFGGSYRRSTFTSRVAIDFIAPSKASTVTMIKSLRIS